MSAFEHFPAKIWPSDEAGCWGLEVDWFCVDLEGFVGVCSTAGQGPVPGIGYSIGFERHNRLLDAIAARTPAGAIPVFETTGRLDYWRPFAEHGLYAFDYQYVHQKEGTLKEGFNLLFRPERPARLEELPEDLQLWLSVANVVFSKIEILRFSEVRH